MDKFMQDFIKRNLPQFVDNFDVIITNEKEEKYKVTAKDAVVTVEASNYICACNGIYEYLKEYCNVQYSWCGTFSFDLKELKMFDGVFEKNHRPTFQSLPELLHIGLLHVLVGFCKVGKRD